MTGNLRYIILKKNRLIIISPFFQRSLQRRILIIHVLWCLFTMGRGTERPSPKVSVVLTHYPKIKFNEGSMKVQ